MGRPEPQPWVAIGDLTRNSIEAVRVAKCTGDAAINGIKVACRKCDHCKMMKLRQDIGRVTAEAFTSDHILFVTGTVSDDLLGEFRLERDVTRALVQQLRRAGYIITYFAVGEYGSKTGRPHIHAVVMFKAGPKQLDIPLGVRLSPDEQKAECGKVFWRWGFIQFETPRGSPAAAVVYLLNYVGKPDSIKLGWSNGMGKTYLLRWARMMGQLGRQLSDGHGIPYTVPGSRKVKKDRFGNKAGLGPLWVYHLPRSHPWCAELVACYIEGWQEAWCDLPPSQNLRGLYGDW